jgi:hypothetical protein
VEGRKPKWKIDNLLGLSFIASNEYFWENFLSTGSHVKMMPLQVENFKLVAMSTLQSEGIRLIYCLVISRLFCHPSHMADRLTAAFAGKSPAFVGYITGGFPGKADTVPVLLAMQEAGVDIIEV